MKKNNLIPVAWMGKIRNDKFIIDEEMLYKTCRRCESKLYKQSLLSIYCERCIKIFKKEVST